MPRCYLYLTSTSLLSFSHQAITMQYYLTTMLSLLCASAQAYDYLTATALVTNAANQSALECWRLSTPLVDSSEPGIAGSLRFNFNASSASYTIIPPRFSGGRHNDPTPQVCDLSALIACPADCLKARGVYIRPGAHLAAIFEGRGMAHWRKPGNLDRD